LGLSFDRLVGAADFANRIRPAVADQRLVASIEAGNQPLPKFLSFRINRLQASQNAASLLNEL
jgi:hypothetical protein